MAVGFIKQATNNTMHLLVLLLSVSALALTIPIQQQVSVTQDTLGNYKFLYDIKDIVRHEERKSNGETKGDYAFRDSKGDVKKIEFTAGVKGFQVAGNHLPLPVQDTPEVANAKARHLAALKAAQLAAPKKPEKHRIPR